MTREECTELARKYGFERVATLNNGTSFLFMDDNCINLTINTHGDFILQYKTKENFMLQQDWWAAQPLIIDLQTALDVLENMYMH